MWDLWDLLRVAPTTFSYRKTELDLLIQALEDTTSTSDFLFLDEVWELKQQWSKNYNDRVLLNPEAEM